jgi:magnesium-protoporphyrin O-methyltransferase
VKDASLLDIGGGIGAIHHELLDDGAVQAVHVDASSAYLEAAREEAGRRGHTERVRFVHADFTDAAADLPPADIVTLDRVVCCYPDYRALLGAAAGRSRVLLGLTYPRERWYVRLGVAIGNAIQRLKRDPFLGFVHPVPEMDGLLRAQGFERVFLRDLFVWEVALYRRSGGPKPASAV